MALSAVPAAELITAYLANWGVFGAKGAGKTTLFGSLPDDMHGLVISTGVENIKPYAPRSNIKVIKIEQWDDLLPVYLQLKRMFCLPTGEPNPSAVELGRHFAICFDTWTRMQGLGARKLLGAKNVAFSKDPALLSDAELAAFLATAPPQLQGYALWNALGELSNQWMGFFQRLPIHKLFLFQHQTREPRTPGEAHLTGPALTPVARDYAWESLEMLGFLYADVEGNDEGAGLLDDPMARIRQINPSARETRRLLIGQHQAYTTKGPTHLLGYAVEQPTWAKLAVTLNPSATVLSLNGKEESAPPPEEPTPNDDIAREVAELF